MKMENGKGTVAEAYGHKFTPAASFTFEFKVFETLEEVQKEYSEKDLIALANAQEKSNARAKEYQKVVEPYKPDPNTPEAIVERMVKDYQKLGLPEDVARQQVTAMLANVKK